MIRRIVIMALLAIFPNSLAAEGVGSSYTPYPVVEYRSAKAPVGYRVFYVSHYARHGSRYLLGAPEEFAAVSVLHANEKALSARGQALLSDLDKVRAAHEGMLGILSEKGFAQHYGIGKNMASHMKGAFHSKTREIRCISSPAPRCIQSMAACVLGLRDGGAKGHIRMDAGHKYYAIISPRMDDSKWRGVAACIRDSILLAGSVPDTLGKRFFLPGQCPVESDLLAMALSLYCMGVSATGLTEEMPDVLGRHLPPAVQECMQRAENAFDYCLFCETLEHGNIRMEKTAKPVLGDIVNKADEAIKDGNIAADLRFGHDSGLLPLMQLTGIGAFAQQHSPESAFDSGWRNDEMIPMAANLQLVFARNAKGRVAVMFLYNEHETTLPALTPFSGCWYNWEEVRDYFLSL